MKRRETGGGEREERRNSVTRFRTEGRHGRVCFIIFFFFFLPLPRLFILPFGTHTHTHTHTPVVETRISILRWKKGLVAMSTEASNVSGIFCTTVAPLLPRKRTEGWRDRRWQRRIGGVGDQAGVHTVLVLMNSFTRHSCHP